MENFPQGGEANFNEQELLADMGVLPEQQSFEPRPLTDEHLDFLTSPNWLGVSMQEAFEAIEKGKLDIPKSAVARDIGYSTDEAETQVFGNINWLKAMALHEGINMDDRASLLISSWLIRNNEPDAAYIYLGKIQDAELRNEALHIGYSQRQMASELTLPKASMGTERALFISLCRAFGRTFGDEADGYDFGKLPAMAENEASWGSVPVNERVKTIGFTFAAGYFLDEKVFNFAIEYYDYLEGKYPDAYSMIDRNAIIFIKDHFGEPYMENSIRNCISAFENYSEFFELLMLQGYTEDIFAYIRETESDRALNSLKNIQWLRGLGESSGSDFDVDILTPNLVAYLRYHNLRNEVTGAIKAINFIYNYDIDKS